MNRFNIQGIPNPYLHGQSNIPITSQARSTSTISIKNNVKLQPIKPSIKLGDAFDRIITDLDKHPLNIAIEKHVAEFFAADRCILWMYNNNLKILYSSTLQQSCSLKKSIISYSFNKNHVYKCDRPPSDDNFDITVDSSSDFSLYIPLYNFANSVQGVLVLTKNPEYSSFSDLDIKKANKFQKKFSYYFEFLVSLHEKASNASNFMTSFDGNISFSSLLTNLADFFQCGSAEFFFMESSTQFYKMSCDSDDFVPLSIPGCTYITLTNNTAQSYKAANQSPHYSQSVDGPGDSSYISQPFSVNDKSFAIVLRNKKGSSQFSYIDSAILLGISPLLSKLFISQSKEEMDDLDSSLSKRLTALLEIAEILSGVLDIDALVPVIMEKSCLLLGTERCSLFLIDKKNKELVTRFHGGLDKSIRIPMNRGFVGHTATTGTIVNISDAYSDPRFDQSVDKTTGYHTKNILTVPIYNNRGEIAGVTEMINKIEGDSFTEEDIKMMMAFNVFCGISLDNARLYQTSIDLTRQIRSFLELSLTLNKSHEMKKAIEQILESAKLVINGQRATLYLREPEKDVLSQFISIGEPPIHGTSFSEIAFKERKSKIFFGDEIAKLSGTTISQYSCEIARTPTDRRLSSIFDGRKSGVLAEHGTVDEYMESICVFPLLTNDSHLFGVMELSTTSRILTEDMKLLECFAIFAAVSIERSQLHDIATFGRLEANMKQWISENERSSFDIPIKLQIPPDRDQTIFANSFDAPAWDGIGHFKVIWKIFHHFGFLKHFKISNEKLFRFLSEISSTYNKVPYHNWRHAVDVTQYIAYQVKLAKLDQILSRNELFGLIVASICHDANHDGFTNVFNVKAETPRGILFKNQSVMEMHHCQVSIRTISKEECNLFSELDAADYKSIWTQIIHLILTTDMAKHHQALQTANEIMDKGNIDLNNPSHRLIMMELVLKCGDISNVSRPFDLADKWADVLCEEFFRQGDLEKTKGMEYSSPLNDREHLDKPKSQIGFYTYVCLPLFKTAARAMPELIANYNQIESNLQEWKKHSQ